MKKLKILTLGSILLSSGVMLAGCGDKTFDESKIQLGNQSVVYNGQEQIFSVGGYDGATITYSKDNKQTFVSAEDLDLKDGGPYTIYYKLSKKGYKDYISSAQEFKINEREITVSISTITDFIENAKTAENIVNNIRLSYQNASNLVSGDVLNINYEIDGYSNDANKEAGESYTIFGFDNDRNYDITIYSGSYKLIDTFSIGSKYYSSLKNAVEDAQPGDTIKLNRDCELSEQVIIDENITIDGNGFAIKASDNFNASKYEGKMSMIGINSANQVTFKNVTLDGNNKTRVMHASAGKVIIDGATVTNGLSSSFIGGVYITGAAEFEMTSGSISGNQCAEEYRDDNYKQYTADLWIGSEASGKLSSIKGGTIGSVFVNANEYSTQTSGFELDGGTIENVYVEYANANGANFKYTSGTLTNLYVSTLASGVAAKATPVEGTQYKGGIVASATSNGIDTLFVNQQEAINYATANPTAYIKAYLAGRELLTAIAGMPVVDEIVLVADITLATNLVVTRDLTLNLNGKKIYNTEDLYNEENKIWSLISVQQGGNLTITGDGTLQAKENDCFAVDVREDGNLTIESGSFIGNVSAVYVLKGTATIKGGTYSIKQLSTGLIDGYDLLINCYDANYADATAKISIQGGSFVNYNPEGYTAQGNFVKDGYHVTTSNVENSVVYNVVKDSE